VTLPAAIETEPKSKFAWFATRMRFDGASTRAGTFGAGPG